MSLRKLKEKYDKEQEQRVSVPHIPPAVIVGAVALVLLAILFIVFMGSPEQPAVTGASTTTTAATEATTTVGPSYGTTTAATTLATQASSTTTTSTTAATTTSTTLAVACKKNADCGMNQEQRVCRQGNVYRQTIRPTCLNPGRINATCMNITTIGSQQLAGETKPEEYCNRGCENGACLQ